MGHHTRRRLRPGKRLYQARERLGVDLALKGIAFGRRIPGYRRHQKTFPDLQDCVTAVSTGALRDPVMSFQMKAGFGPLMALRNNAPDDKAPGGHAVLMVCRNP